MDTLEWFKNLCRYNDGTKAPREPLSVLMSDGDVYTFGTDLCSIVVAHSLPGIESAHTFETASTTEPFQKILEVVRAAQEQSKEVGVLDALLLKEIVGEPTWTKEEVEAIWEKEQPNVCIGDSYYTVPVLARTLAGWQEPLAKVYQAPAFFMREGGRDDLLMICGSNLLALCAPYWKSDEQTKLLTVELPEGWFVPKKG